MRGRLAGTEYERGAPSHRRGWGRQKEVEIMRNEREIREVTKAVCDALIDAIEEDNIRAIIYNTGVLHTLLWLMDLIDDPPVDA